MRYLTIMAVALGVLAIPSSAFATHQPNCPPPPKPMASSGDLHPDPNKTVIAYSTVNSPPYLVKVSVCADFNGQKFPPGPRFDGGTVEAGVGEDQATGTADPGLVNGGNQPDAYAVVDGDNDNQDPAGQSDGYFGVSNWEKAGPGGGNKRTSDSECTSSGPDNGNTGSSNSGGCVGVDPGAWVYVPHDVPTPVCGNTSGNNWDGSGTGNPNRRDGCSIP